MSSCMKWCIGVFVILMLVGGLLWYRQQGASSALLYTNTQYGYAVHYPKDLPLDTQDPKAVSIGVVSFEPGPGALFMSVDEGEALVTPAELQDQTGSQCQEMVLAASPAVHCAGSEGFAGGSTTTYMVQVGTNLLSFYYIHGDEASNHQMEAIVKSLEIKK